MTSVPGKKKKKKQYDRLIDPFGSLSSPLLTNVELLLLQTNGSVEKGFYKTLKSKYPF